MSDCPHWGDEKRLYGNVDGSLVCVNCWKKAGRPWPRRAVSAVELATAEVKTREKMMKRGGNERYMARSGKA